MPYCRACGESVQASADTCPHCGTEQWPADDGGTGNDGDGPPAGSDRDDDGSGSLWDDVDGPIESETPYDGGRDRSRSDRSDAEEGDRYGAYGRPPEGEAGRGGPKGSAGGRGEDDGRGGDGGSRGGGTGGDAAAGDPTASTDQQPGAQPAAAPTGPFPFEAGAASFGFGYPTRAGYESVLLGGLLSMVPFLGLVTEGFVLRVTRAAARGRQSPPEFDGIGGLFVDGLKFLVLTIAWYVGVFVAAVSTAGVTTAASEAVGTVAVVVVVLGITYVFPGMVTAMAVHDRFGAAFSREILGPWLTSSQYVGAFVGTIVLSILLSILVIASIVTIVGVIFVAAWALYVIAAYWGYHYRRAVAEGLVPPAPEPA